MTKLDELIQELCPDGVKYKALGEICKLVTGATPSKTNAAYWENGTIPWMSSGEVNLKRVAATEKKITQLGYEKNSTTIVPKHSVVIALAGQGKTRGKAAITEIELCTNQSLCSMICNENLDYKFLYYILDGKYEELRAISNGDGTRGGLSLKILAPYKIPVPPLPVQREIVRILDNFTELTAELTARKQQYAYYRDKLLTFAAQGETILTDKPNALNRLCQYVSEFIFVKLSDISVNCDSLRKPVTSGNREAGNIPYYGASGIVDYVKDYIFDGDYLLISEDGANLLARNTPIAFSISGKNWVNNHAHILRFNNRITQRYVEIYLNSIDLSPYISGGAQPKLNQQNLYKIPIPLPSYQKQKEIVTILDRFDTLCTDLSSGLPAEIEARQKQYEYYRDKLLTFREISN